MFAVTDSSKPYLPLKPLQMVNLLTARAGGIRKNERELSQSHECNLI